MSTEVPQRTPNVPPRLRLFFRVRLLMLGTGLVASILMLADVFEPFAVIALFAASIVVYLGVSFLFWRCPTCQKYPGNAVMPDFCEQCGSAIFGPDASVPDRPPSHPAGETSSLRWVLIGRAAYGLILLVYFLMQNVVGRVSVLLFWAGAVALLAGGAWVEWRWWRCPHCGGYLRRALWPGRKCVKCGSELRF